MRNRILMAAVAGAMLATLPVARAAAPDATMQKARQAIGRGIEYLHRTQETDGSWQHYPATTALALSALLRNGKTENNDPAVAKGVQFLIRSVQRNGGIYANANAAIALPNYNTCLAVMALTETKNPVYKPTIKRALQYLEKVQFDEGEGIQPSNPMYGGIGYGDDPGDDTHPDLSNLQFALEALHEGGVPSGAPVFKKALIFLQRVQNRRETNDQSWVKEGPNDGGFVYTSQGGTPEDEGKAVERHRSYGSMTYAGLKSYIYAGVSKSDPRAQAAWNWIRSNYSVAEHPGMGSTSLYYYYHTMAKTLDVFGDRIVKDTKGVKHDWARDLAGALVAAQHPDGSWSNNNARYWENRPALVTSYSLISLSYCIGH
ncbi:MAG TPA: hypothetical protein VKT77_15515 [Chthonomonadaceae bacterium]|nr:hypothetical protein [Chthonomonadaceae bacterium]